MDYAILDERFELAAMYPTPSNCAVNSLSFKSAI
jgi:hypothetical protein